jgi:DivIVA domain-containing protein
VAPVSSDFDPGVGPGPGARFNAAFRGYEPSSVDRYIDELEQRLAEAQASLVSLEAQLAAATGRANEVERREGERTELGSAELEAMKESIAVLLRAAHVEAQAVCERADADAETKVRLADELVALAEKKVREASSLRERAEAEARTIVRQAAAQASLREAEALMARMGRTRESSVSEPSDGPDT